MIVLHDISRFYLIYIFNSPFRSSISYATGTNVMQVPHLKVLEHVSSVLRDLGFCPTGEGIDVKNLSASYCIPSNDFAFLVFLIMLLFFLLFFKLPL